MTDDQRYREPYLLYADDDEDDKAILLDNMRGIGGRFNVYTTENGRQLLNLLDDLKSTDTLPFCIILDINMPIMNGAQTLEALKKHPVYRHVPVFLFSTASRLPHEDLAQRLGAEAFITKPHRQKDLIAICEQFAAYCRRAPLFKTSVTHPGLDSR